MRQVIFDYDGVLVDSFDFHFNKVNELYNIGLTLEEWKDVHNGNFYEAPLEKFAVIDFTEYATTVAPEQAQLPLIDGARETLTTLARDHAVHLITSGWRVQVEGSLAAHGILDVFTSCLYADNGLSKHEKLASLLHAQNATADGSIFVTDTLGDLREAQTLQVPTIAVTFGFHDEARLRQGSPTYIVHSFNEIFQAVGEYDLLGG